MGDVSGASAQAISKEQCDFQIATTGTEEHEATELTHYLAAWRLTVVIASLCLGTLLVAIDTTIISVAVPKIATEFQAINDIGWYGSAYLMTVTAFQPAFGSVYKLFDAKWSYLSSILAFEGESLD